MNDLDQKSQSQNQFSMLKMIGILLETSALFLLPYGRIISFFSPVLSPAKDLNCSFLIFNPYKKPRQSAQPSTWSTFSPMSRIKSRWSNLLKILNLSFYFGIIRTVFDRWRNSSPAFLIILVQIFSENYPCPHM